METILAAAVLSLVLMVLFNLYPSSLLMTRRAEHRLQAASLAQSILETERSRPFTQLLTMLDGTVTCSNRPAGPPPATLEVAESRGGDGVVLKPELAVFVPDQAKPVDPTKPLRVVGVRVTVRWTEAWVQDGSTGQRAANQVLVQEFYVGDVKR